MSVNTFSYWEKTAFLGAADVVIIGSGLVGLSAALALKRQRPALKVSVLERGFLPAGASTKNAGFACFGTVSEQLAYLEHASAAQVAQLADYKWRGLQRLRQNLGDDHIDYFQYGGYELFADNDTSRADFCIGQIDKLNQLLKDVIGAADIYTVANDKIAGFGFRGISRMIYNPFEGQLHTGKMMRRLLHLVQSLGVMVFNGCTIRAVENDGGAITLLTDQGRFGAAKVIVATNAFAARLFPQLAVTPGRGQVLVTKPVNGLKLRGTYHFDHGYYYFRNIDGRVLFGGGRNLNFKAEETCEFGNTEAVQRQLEYYLREMILPGQRVEIDYWWSGIMGFGADISPIVREVEPDIFCAVRLNGMGVAMGSLVGEEVAEMALKS